MNSQDIPTDNSLGSVFDFSFNDDDFDYNDDIISGEPGPSYPTICRYCNKDFHKEEFTLYCFHCGGPYLMDHDVKIFVPRQPNILRGKVFTPYLSHPVIIDLIRGCLGARGCVKEFDAFNQEWTSIVYMDRTTYTEFRIALYHYLTEEGQVKISVEVQRTGGDHRLYGNICVALEAVLLCDK
jgi:hypothetical protein